MANTIRTRGAKVIIGYDNDGSVPSGIPDFLIPNKEKGITTPSAIYAALTMTSTSATIEVPATEGSLSPTGCTLNEYANIKPKPGAFSFFGSYARRKPGTTGSIASQTVTFTVNSVVIGKYNVSLAAAGADPQSGYVTFLNTAGDARCDMSTYPLTIGVTAADPDLEIVICAVGAQD